MADRHTRGILVDTGGEAVTVTGGKLDVNATVTVTGGDASAANQTSQITQETEINGHVHSIDGKITACNTGAVVLTTSTAEIGNVKNAGTFAVQATDVVPGTAATNLGKAKGSTKGATDTGVAMLMPLEFTDVHTTDAVNNYDFPRLTAFHELKTRDQRAIDLANCNVHTEYTVLSNDTINKADSANHVFGVGAITFDKANGTANTVYAGVSKAFTAIDLSEIFESGGFVGLGVYLPSLTNVVNVFLRAGTDASNYNCWTWPVASLTVSTWLNLRTAAASPDYARNLGTGWNTAAIAYVAFGVEYALETNTASGLIFDHVHIVGGRVTSSDINASISSSVTTPNVNINRVGGTSTDTANGAATAGTLRVTVANDSTGQIKLAAGTAEIGKLAAGTAVVGVAIKSDQLNTVYNGTTSVTPATALANVAASQTDSSLVSATASQVIRVLALVMVAGATATNITFNTKPAGAGTAISCLFANAANGGAVLPYNPAGWFTTASGEGLTCTTGAGATTGIQVVYAKY